MSTRETNTEFVTRIMECSVSGAMMQLVVLQALGYYADTVLSDPEAIRASMKDSFIHPDAWIRCCEELQAELKQKADRVK